MLIDSLGQGGAEQSLIATLPHLGDHGIDVEVSLLTSVAPDRERALVEAGVPVRVLGPTGGLIDVARRVRRLVTTTEPDLVHATLFSPIVGAALGTIRTGVPVLASMVNTPPVFGRDRPVDTAGSPAKVRAAVAVEAFTCRRLVEHLHAVTPGVRDAVIERFRVDPARITVAERGRDGQRFRPPSAAERSEARAVFSMGADDEVLVALGRHDPQKGFVDLIEAVHLLAADRPRLRLLIAGREGTATAALREAIDGAGLADRITLLGDRPDPERVLAAGDLFVLSSRREGTSGATIEAMASGLAVVATELDGLRGIVVDGEQARTVPVADPSALAAAIAEVLDDPDLATAFGRAGRSTFESRFTVERSVAALAALYRQTAVR